MSKSSEQLFRQWTLLQKIPVRPSSKTANQLLKELIDEGFVVGKRTIERDLNELKLGPFSVSSDEKGVGNNPNRWFFERDAKLHTLPAMSTQMAFTLMFAQKVLADQLPPAVLTPMKPIFSRAGQTLQSAAVTYKNWDKYVKHVPRTLSMKKANIREDVLGNCLEATLRGKRLSIRYRPRHGNKMEYQVNPLGLVYRDTVIYLVCTLWEYEDVKQLALHRMDEVELLEKTNAHKPSDFDLDRYISEEGSFLYVHSPSETMRVKIKFYTDTVQHLSETPLSDDQLIQYEDNFSIVEATVLDSMQLRWWLLGFGEHIEVLEPAELRNEFRKTAIILSRMYNSTSAT